MVSFPLQTGPLLSEKWSSLSASATEVKPCNQNILLLEKKSPKEKEVDPEIHLKDQNKLRTTSGKRDHMRQTKDSYFP